MTFNHRLISTLITIMIYNGKEVGHSGLEVTTYTKHGFGQHLAAGTVNGGHAVRGGVSELR